MATKKKVVSKTTTKKTTPKMRVLNPTTKKVVKSFENDVENRVVTQTKLYRLIQNPLVGAVNDSKVTATSTNRLALIEWMNGELAKNVDSFQQEGKDHKGNRITTHYTRDFEKGSYLQDFRKVKATVNEYGQGVDFIWINEDELAKEKSELATIIMIGECEIMTYPKRG